MNTTIEQRPAEIPTDAWKWMQAKARQVASSFGYSEADDLAQDAWIWTLQSKTGRRGWWGDGEFDYSMFRLDIERRLTKVAARDRAEVLGERDSFGLRYSIKEVAYLLSELWTRGYLPQHGNDGPAVSTSVDHSKGPDLPAKIADLAKVYRKVITPGSIDDQILFRICGLGYTQREVGEALNLSQPAVSARKDAALGDIARALNHTSWGRTWNDPDEWNDGPGTRKVVSNGEAQASASI